MSIVEKVFYENWRFEDPFFGRIPPIALNLTASEIKISFSLNLVKILEKYL